MKYKEVLITGDAKVLISLPSAQRRHAMEGLSALSKYAGCYDNWKNIPGKVSTTLGKLRTRKPQIHSLLLPISFYSKTSSSS